MPITVTCTNCGSQLKLKDANTIGTKVTCPQCHQAFLATLPPADSPQELPDLENFSAEYGAPLPPPPGGRSGSAGNRKRRKSRSNSSPALLLVGIGVAAALVLLALVGGGLWLGGVISFNHGEAEVVAEAESGEPDDSVAQGATAVVGGFDTPEEAWEFLRQDSNDEIGHLVDAIPPSEHGFLALGQIAMIRFFVQFAALGENSSEMVDAYNELLARHDLTDKLVFDENPDNLLENCARAFEDVDIEQFLIDVVAFHKKYLPNGNRQDEHSTDRSGDGEPELRDVRITGDEATATQIGSDGSESEIVFVREDGRWYHSPFRTEMLKKAANDSGGWSIGSESAWSIGLELVVTYETPEAFAAAEKRPLVQLLQNVKYNKRSEVEFEKDEERQRVLLTIYGVDRGDRDTVKKTLQRAPGVKEVQHKLAADLAEGFEQWGERMRQMAALERLTLQPMPASGEIPRSGQSAAASSIAFFNSGEAAFKLYWVDPAGQRQACPAIPADGTHHQDTYAGHVFLLTDLEDQPLGYVVATEKPGRLMLPAPAQATASASGGRAADSPLNGAQIVRDQGGRPIAISYSAELLTDEDLARIAEMESLQRVYLAQTYRMDVYRRDRTQVYHPTEVTPEGLGALAQLPNLKELSVNHLAISDEGLVAIGEIKSLTRFSVCPKNFSYNNPSTISDHGLQTLATFPQLESLALGGCQQITDSGLSYLARMPRLRSLDLHSTPVSDAGLERLRPLTILEELVLFGCYKISDTGMAAIGRFSNLRDLDIGQTRVTDSGLQHLAGLKDLEVFRCSSTQIGDAGLRHLSELQNLRSLNLIGTRITDASVETLAAWPKLRDVNLFRSAMSQNGVEQLRTQLPNARVSDGSPQRPSNTGNATPAQRTTAATLFRQGQALWNGGKRAEARQIWQRALSAAESAGADASQKQLLAQIALQLGRSYAVEKQWTKAADFFDKSFEPGRSSDFPASFETAMVLLLDGRDEKFKELVGACSKKEFPDSEHFKTRLNMLAPGTFENQTELVRIADQVVAERNDIWYKLVQGATNCRAGNFETAEEQLRSVDWRRGTGDWMEPLRLYWLALACAGQDKADEARQFIEQADAYRTRTLRMPSWVHDYDVIPEVELIRREAYQTVTGSPPPGDTPPRAIAP